MTLILIPATVCAVAGLTLAAADVLRGGRARWADGFTTGCLTAAAVFFISAAALVAIL